jgi:hypothetical protein
MLRERTTLYHTHAHTRTAVREQRLAHCSFPHADGAGGETDELVQLPFEERH